MIRNYLLIAFRNLRRHRAFSVLNIAGLTIGLTCSILILLWVQDERSYDTFHKNADNIYRIIVRESGVDMAVMPIPATTALQAALPSIQRATEVKLAQGLFKVNDRTFEEKHILYADSNFLRMFTYPLIAGRLNSAPDGIVITAEVATRYFGTINALGRIIRLNNDIVSRDLTVTGILKNPPVNSHLQFNIILPFSLYQLAKDYDGSWGNHDVFAYIQSTSPDLKLLTREVTDILHKSQGPLSPGATPGIYTLQPLKEIHLFSGRLLLDVDKQGNIQSVRIFFLIALFILGIASINFMNLSTALSGQRAKEVGMRKAIGALKKQLFVQFIGESVLLSVISLLLAIILASLLLPLFNHLADKQMNMGFLNPINCILFLAIAIGTGIIAGSYPAFFLSSFKPVQVLKGITPTGRKSLSLRNGLVIFQFAISAILILSTLVVFSQLQYIRHRQIGFDKENLLYVEMPQTGDLTDNTQALRAELQMTPGLTDYTFTSHLPTYLTTGTDNVLWPGKDPSQDVIIPHFNVDAHFLKTFRMQLAAGRFFREAAPADKREYVVNETAVKLMHVKPEEAIGMPFSLNDRKGEIIGVVKDFNFKPVHTAIEPLVLKLNTSGGYLVLRVAPEEIEHTMSLVQNIFKKVYPDSPFSYSFVDKDLDHLYISEKRMGQLFNIFALLSILISSLGLFGLAAFTAQRRLKEIGIRKILGASVGSIVGMLSKDFLQLVLISLIVGFPIAWLAMDTWLQNFVYRIQISWWMYGAAGIIALLIALLTVSYQSIAAAVTNPVKSLKE